MFYYISTEGNINLLIEFCKWAGIFIGLYFSISAVGYLFKNKFYDKYKSVKEKAMHEREMGQHEL